MHSGGFHNPLLSSASLLEAGSQASGDGNTRLYTKRGDWSVFYSNLICCFCLDVPKAVFTHKHVQHLSDPCLYYVGCQLIKELGEQAETVKGDSLEALR